MTSPRPPKFLALLAPALLFLPAGPAAWFARTTTQRGPLPALADTANGAAARGRGADESARAAASFGELPLAFEANAGQFDPRVRFVSRGPGYGLFLTADEAVLALRRGGGGGAESVLRMKMVGANRAPRAAGRGELPGRASHFVGRDASRWRANVPTYARVEYEEVYPGVSLAYYGKQRQLEYDFRLAPGADVRRIRLAFAGADAVEIDRGGDLVLRVAGAQVRQLKPFAYQETAGGARREVESRYVARGGGEIGFEVGAHDPARPLVIDPVFVFSTFLGGIDVDSGNGLAIDAQRNVYVTGHTWSADFPLVNPASPARRGFADIFVTKLNPQGTAVLYSTYVGASMGDTGSGIDVDDAGNAYVCGTSTLGGDFPLVNPFDATPSGGDDGVVFKLTPAGDALVYSTYLNGSTGGSLPGDINVNRRTGEATVAGLAGNTHPTTAGSFQPNAPGPASFRAGFVTRLSPQGNALVWSTFYHGFAIASLALDADDNVYLTGSANLPFQATPNAAQPACNSCLRPEQEPDAGIAKLNSSGSAVLFATFLGGSQRDAGAAVAVDAARNVYVTGTTQSASTHIVPFPTTPGAFQTASQGIPDAFVTKLSADGSAFVYSTYLGGSVSDAGLGIAADAGGHAHVTGRTQSLNFPTVAPLQASLGGSGSFDAFVTTLNPSGSAPIFSTYLGGVSRDEGFEIVSDEGGNVYVTGQTYATNFPVTAGAFQTDPDGPGPGGGSGDAFVTKIHVYDPVRAGDIVVSEFRLSGPAGPRDEFVELHNRTDDDITVQTADGSAGWAVVASDGAVRVIIPAGTRLRARGHYLVTNGAGYSLAAYPAGDDGASPATAAGDLSYTADIPAAGGVAVFRTSDAAGFTLANRLDAAGYASAPALYREGAGLAAGGIELAWPFLDHSHARDLSAGAPRDTDDNAADFVTLETQSGPDPICGPSDAPPCPPRDYRLGAPGPQNSRSQTTRNGQIKASLIDPSCDGIGTPSAGCQNLVRDTSATDPTIRRQGTFSIRRRFTNTTGLPVTSLRFRIVDLTTLFSPGYWDESQADLRALTSADTFVTTADGARVPVTGTTLEQPPAQEIGGGYNSTLSAGRVTLAEPLAPGASVNVQFLLGVARAGAFRFFVNVEATTAGPDASAAEAPPKHGAAGGAYRRKRPRPAKD